MHIGVLQVPCITVYSRINLYYALYVSMLSRVSSIDWWQLAGSCLVGCHKPMACYYVSEQYVRWIFNPEVIVWINTGKISICIIYLCLETKCHSQSKSSLIEDAYVKNVNTKPVGGSAMQGVWNQQNGINLICIWYHVFYTVGVNVWSTDMFARWSFKKYSQVPYHGLI